MTVHKSKVDLWLAAILISAFSAGLAASAGALIAAPFPANLTGLITPAVLFPVGWALLGTRYVIGATELVVRAGPFRWRLPLAGIRKITPTNNPLSSPALSLDRIRIDYELNGRPRSIMISPKDKARFMADLREAGAVFEG